MSITATTNTVTKIASSSATCGGTLAGTSSGNYIPIVDHILTNKAKLFHRTRQKIVSDVKIMENIKPFTLFENEKESESGVFKQFVLTAYTWKPISEVLEVELMEYDNSSGVNFVEVP